LRFSWREVRRGIFIDGHEQPDVVEYLKEFREKMRRLSAWRKGPKLAQEPSPEHKLSGLLDQRSLAEDPPVIRLARLIPEHFVTHVGVRWAAGE
jgi:hypothetical protein